MISPLTAIRRRPRRRRAGTFNGSPQTFNHLLIVKSFCGVSSGALTLPMSNAGGDKFDPPKPLENFYRYFTIYWIQIDMSQAKLANLHHHVSQSVLYLRFCRFWCEREAPAQWPLRCSDLSSRRSFSFVSFAIVVAAGADGRDGSMARWRDIFMPHNHFYRK